MTDWSCSFTWYPNLLALTTWPRRPRTACPSSRSLYPRAVVGGVVKEIHPQVEGAVQGEQRLGVVDLAPAGWGSIEREWTTDPLAPCTESADLEA